MKIQSLVAAGLVAMVWAASFPVCFADTYQTFGDEFNKAVLRDFAWATPPSGGKLSVLVRKDLLADAATKVLARSQLHMSAHVAGHGLSLEPARLILHTDSLDCSVNKACFSCDGKKLFARAGCEIARATCAAHVSPWLAACTAAKKLDNTELGHIDLSGATLDLSVDLHEFSVSIDPTLTAATAAPKVNARGAVNNLRAAVHLQVVVGIFGGCPLPPTINVPSIGVSLKNTTVPVKSSLSLLTSASGTDGATLKVSIDGISVNADVDTGDIFDWIKSNPMALITCPLPSVAAFAYATRLEHRSVDLAAKTLPLDVASLRIHRDGHIVIMAPTVTNYAVGVEEIP